MNKYESYKKVNLPWLNEIPSHWEFIKLKRIANFITGNSIKDEDKPKYSNNNFSRIYVSTSDIDGNSMKIKHKSNIYIPVDNKHFKISKKGSTLVCIEGGSGGKKVAFVYSDVNFGNKLCSIKANDLVDKFIYYVILSQVFKTYFQLKINGDRNGVSLENIGNFLFPLPPISEQEQIANYLDWKINEVDKLILVEKEKINQIKKLIKLKINNYFENIMKFSKDNKRLRFLYNFQNGISTSKDYINGTYPFLTYSDVYGNLLLPEKLSGKINSTKQEQDIYSIKKGDLFFTRTSEKIEDAARVSLALKDIENAVFNGFTIRLRPNENNRLVDKFVLYYLDSDLVRHKILNKLNLVTRVSIKQDILKDILIPIIKEDEQIKIVENIESIRTNCLKKIKFIEQKINQLQLLKQSLIAEVVTGKIDVRDVVIPKYEKSTIIEEDEIEEMEV